jgi:hypothetical protein
MSEIRLIPFLFSRLAVFVSALPFRRVCVCIGRSVRPSIVRGPNRRACSRDSRAKPGSGASPLALIGVRSGGPPMTWC